MGDFLVETPVGELLVGDWVYDTGYEARRIASIRREDDRSYLTFDHGPSNWFHHKELLPTERMS